MRRTLKLGRFADCCFLFLLCLVSTVPYLAGLGFYSDDWNFMAASYQCENQSLVGVCRCLWQGSRPLQSLELATLYKGFGFHPFGYHFCNMLIFGLAVVLFYLALRELNFSRLTSVMVPAVYAFLPHYSADRFWIAAAQANLSVALCFLCFYASTKASADSVSRRWLWLCVGIVSMTTSVFSYEAAAPLFALVPIVIYRRFCRRPTELGAEATSPRDSLRVAVFVSIVVVLIMALKYSVQTRVQLSSQLHRAPKFGSVIRNALLRFINFNYGTFSFGLPKLAWRCLRMRWDPSIVVISVLVGIVVSIWIWIVARQPVKGATLRHNSAILIFVGTLIYCLGYAPFVTANFKASPFAMVISGIENRLMIAMAIGTAMAVAGVVGVVVGFLSKDWLRNGILSLSLGFLCGCGSVVIDTEASYWHAASLKQREVLTSIRGTFPALPHGTTVLLDGICPYVGPGIVFESDWDLSGALRLLYRDPTIGGDVIRPTTAVLPDRIVTFIYGDEEHSYPYENNLVLYDAGRQQACSLKDNLASRACLDSSTWMRRTCPEGNEGAGVPIF